LCQWGVIHKKSCGGHPRACGPWNGRCAAREAFLEANLLHEPRFPGDLVSELDYIAGFDRAEALVQRMNRFRNRNPNYDFGRGPRRP
jgi:hypothetical protein